MNTAIEIKERPILFSTPMVQAILEGRKTQTRRIVSKSNSLHNLQWEYFDWNVVHINKPVGLKVKCKGQDELWRISPKWQVGDILWVRESWCKTLDVDEFTDGYLYKAEYADPSFTKWKPSIHMPRAACRIRLEITDIKVERLQEISREDAIAEGMPHQWQKMKCGEFLPDPRGEFYITWSKINGAESWNQNPWVWVISFERISNPLQVE